MEAQELINILNKRLIKKIQDPEWNFKSDQKKFGFGSPKKNKHSKRGYSNGTKEERKLYRQEVRAKRHILLKAGLLDENIEKSI